MWWPSWRRTAAGDRVEPKQSSRMFNITMLQVAQMQRPPQQPQLWHQPPPNVVEFSGEDFVANHTTVYPHYQIFLGYFPISFSLTSLWAFVNLLMLIFNISINTFLV